MSYILHVIAYDKNSKFEDGIYISDGSELEIGRYVRVNENVFFQGKVSLGDYVMIAPNVAFYSSTHIYGSVDEPMVTLGLSSKKGIVVEDDVWVGRNVVVLPGVRIGKGSIVGANAVVNCNIEPYSIVGGVPAKLIRKRI